MGKILGKSALCFAGLVALGYSIEKLTVQLIHVTNLTRILGIIHVTIVQHVLWFLLAIVYAYVLYRLFRKERQCCLIIAANGIAVIALFWLLTITNIGPDRSLVYDIYNIAGLPTLMFALIFKNIRPATVRNPYHSNQMKAIPGTLLKSMLCFLAFAVLLFGYACLDAFFLYSILWLAVASIDTVLPLFAIAYAYALYRLFCIYKRYILIALCNAGFLLVLWGLQLIPGIASLFDHGHIVQSYRILLWLFTGNTAIVTITLAFVFRSVEKRKAALPANQNAPDADSIPAQ